MKPTEAFTSHHSQTVRRAASGQTIDAARIPESLLAMRTASEITGLSKATLYRLAATDPTFPKLVKLGTRCTRIRAGDLLAWLDAQAGVNAAS